jgi:hypothetical protein
MWGFPTSKRTGTQPAHARSLIVPIRKGRGWFSLGCTSNRSAGGLIDTREFHWEDLKLRPYKARITLGESRGCGWTFNMVSWT